MFDIIDIENQNKITLKGATKVRTSTPSSSVIESDDDVVIISGSELEVKKLDLENKEVSLSGKFSSIKFQHGNEKQSFLKRIFK